MQQSAGEDGLGGTAKYEPWVRDKKTKTFYMYNQKYQETVYQFNWEILIYMCFQDK